MAAGFSTGGGSPTLVAPTERSQAFCSIKGNFITVNGKYIESTQPFINIARHFQLISEMSVNYLTTLGHFIGFAPTLDNPKAAKYQPVV